MRDYLKERYVDVYYDSDSQLGYAVWKDFANEKDYMRAVDAQLNMILESQVELFICDIRKFKGTTPNAQKYTTEQIMPKMYHTSKLKKIAYIVGEDIFANFTLSVIRKNIDKEAYLHTNAFRTIDQAINWLEE